MRKVLLLLIAFFAILGVNAQDPANIKVLLDTDFTVFTEGSEESPKSLYSTEFNKLATGYSYVSGVAAAGGKLLVKESGYLQLNSFSDIPSAGGTIRVTAEVFMLNYDGLIQFQPSYTTADYVNEVVEAGKWVKVVTLVGNMRSTSKLKIIPFLSISGFYIKSLKIEYSPDFIAAPEAYLPSDADGTQFTATCSVNSSAAKYEADVFSYDKDGKVVYFAKDVELKKLTAYSTTATGKVTGLDPKVTYYYVARCVNANGVKSADSEIVKVVKKLTSIAAPKALPATNVTSAGFTANWEEVSDANSYIVNTYTKRTLTKDETISVFAEDFSGVTVGTETSIEFSGDLNSYTNMKGWTAESSSKAFAKGYFVLAPIGNTGNVITPAINLSSVNGKFQFVLKGATRDYAGYNVSADTLKVDLVDLDGKVIESAPIKILDKAGYTDYTFDFTKGTKDSRIRITFTRVEGSTMKLFIDEINVLQTFAAGSVVDRMLSSVPSDTTSLKVEMNLEDGIEYSYSVIAVGETVEGSGAYAVVAALESKESDRVVVEYKGSGVEEIETVNAAPKAWKESNGVLIVTGCNVLVADLSGKIILRRVSDEENTYNVNYNGIVVVLVDGKSYKFAL